MFEKNPSNRFTLIKEKACDFRSIGWSVMPIKHRSKSPALFAWKELIDRPMTSAEFTKSFTDPKFGGGNLALITGRISGVTVVDIDNKRADGCDVIDPTILMKRLPKTLMSRTGGGGYHLFYQYADIKNSTRHIHAQVDIKNQGGYVLLPPSIHNKTGLEYAWERTKHPWLIANFPKEIAPFPEKLLTIDSAKRSHPSLKRQEWARIISGVSNGTRNNDLTRIIGRLLHAFARHPVTYVDDLKPVHDLILAWNSRCNPPLPIEELDRTFNSIANSYYGELTKTYRPE